MKIVRMEAKNVKRLRAVAITPAPDGRLVVVGGDNGQGKTSVLDSIMYALAGKDSLPREPLRRGTDSGEVVVDLGDFTVRRTFTKEGTTNLTIDTKDGGRLMQPQTRLDDLVGRLSFDPLEFSRMKPPQQSETLRELVGLEFSSLDEVRTSRFSDRTIVGRELKSLEARLGALARHQDVPEKELSTAAVLAELQAAEDANLKNDVARSELKNLEQSLGSLGDQYELLSRKSHETAQEIARLRERHEREKAAVEACAAQIDERKAEHAAKREEIAALADVDVEPIKTRLLMIEGTNRKVRENQAQADLAENVARARARVELLTQEIQGIDVEKRRQIAAAPFPVEGLGFDDQGGVTLNGIPFDQASAAEQLRVSAAMGLALNPTLRILLIRDGSLLDDSSLAMLAELAAEHDAQLWIERVEKDGATVIIEDGQVCTTTTETPEPISSSTVAALKS